MPISSVEKSFCTTREAATLLGVSVGTVQLWSESGLLQAWKTAGGHRRVIRESVEKLLHKASTPAPVPARRELVIEPPGVAMQSSNRRLQVLVVEDDVNLLRLYETRLAHWPMAPEVVVANNAFAALLIMGRTCPDLLITDLRMPGIDGFVMLSALRKAPEASNTRIVVVTGMDKSEIAARGGLPSDIEVLGKPIPFDRLQLIAMEVLSTWQSASRTA
jgi:excisionase family DNA binding protein